MTEEMENMLLLKKSWLSWKELHYSKKKKRIIDLRVQIMDKIGTLKWTFRALKIYRLQQKRIRLILEELNKGYKLRLLSSCFTLFKEGCLKSHETKLQNEIKAAKLGELHSKKTMKHYFKGWKEIPIAIQKKKENKIKAIKFWYSMIISKSFNIMKFKYQRKRYIKDLEGDILPFRTMWLKKKAFQGIRANVLLENWDLYTEQKAHLHWMNKTKRKVFIGFHKYLLKLIYNQKLELISAQFWDIIHIKHLRTRAFRGFKAFPKIKAMTERKREIERQAVRFLRLRKFYNIWKAQSGVSAIEPEIVENVGNVGNVENVGNVRHTINTQSGTEDREEDKGKIHYSVRLLSKAFLTWRFRLLREKKLKLNLFFFLLKQQQNIKFKTFLILRENSLQGAKFQVLGGYAHKLYIHKLKLRAWRSLLIHRILEYKKLAGMQKIGLLLEKSISQRFMDQLKISAIEGMGEKLSNAHYHHRLLRRTYTLWKIFFTIRKKKELKSRMSKQYYFMKTLNKPFILLKRHMAKKRWKKCMLDTVRKIYFIKLKRKALNGFLITRRIGMIQELKELKVRNQYNREMLFKSFERIHLYTFKKKYSRGQNQKAEIYNILRLEKPKFRQWKLWLNAHKIRKLEKKENIDSVDEIMNNFKKRAYFGRWIEYHKSASVKTIKKNMCDDHYQVNSLRKYLRKLKLYIMKRNIKATKKGLSDSLYTKALIRKCLRNLQDYLLKNKIAKKQLEAAINHWASYKYYIHFEHWKQFLENKRRKRKEEKGAFDDREKVIRKKVIKKWFDVGFYWVNKKVGSGLSTSRRYSKERRSVTDINNAMKYALRWKNRFLYNKFLENKYSTYSPEHKNSYKKKKNHERLTPPKIRSRGPRPRSLIASYMSSEALETRETGEIVNKANTPEGVKPVENITNKEEEMMKWLERITGKGRVIKPYSDPNIPSKTPVYIHNSGISPQKVALAESEQEYIYTKHRHPQELAKWRGHQGSNMGGHDGGNLTNIISSNLRGGDEYVSPYAKKYNSTIDHFAKKRSMQIRVKQIENELFAYSQKKEKFRELRAAIGREDQGDVVQLATQLRSEKVHIGNLLAEIENLKELL